MLIVSYTSLTFTFVSSNFNLSGVKGPPDGSCFQVNVTSLHNSVNLSNTTVCYIKA